VHYSECLKDGLNMPFAHIQKEPWSSPFIPQFVVCKTSESVIQEHVMHMTEDITQEIEKGQEAIHKLVWRVRTTSLTDLTSCTGYTSLTS
jgi:hypothetical protein